MDKPASILLVDDDPAILRLFSAILCREGYQVWEASAARQGLQMARERRPDIVMLDAVLPDMGGLEVCREIKSDPALKDTFVVMISGQAISPASKASGLETGADEYLTKPVFMDELVARIRTALRLRKAAEALRASEHHYRRLVEMLPDALGLIDNQGNVLEVNPQAAAMLGYAQPEELVGKNVLDFTPPELHQKLREDIIATLKSGSLRRAELVAVKNNGSRIPVELSAAMSGGNAEPAGLVILARDITQRKQAETRIRQLVHTLDQAHDAIIIRGLDGRIQYFNRGAELLLGWKAGEVMGMSAGLYYEKPDEFDPAPKALLETGEWSGEVRLITKKRQRVIAHTRWTLAHDDTSQSPWVICINTDITERKRVEARLRLQSAALESAANAIVITDRNGDVTWVNSAFSRLSGYSEEDTLGQNLLFLISGNHDPSTPGSIWQTIFSDQVWRGELVNQRKDGSLYVEENVITPVQDENGRITHFIAVKQDVTDRKRTERLLQLQRDFGLFLGAANDLRATAERLLEIALENDTVDCGAVYLMDWEKASLDLVARRGLSENFAQRASAFGSELIQTHYQEADFGFYRQQGEPMSGIARHFRHEGLLSVEAVPIRCEGKLVAVLHVGSHAHPTIPVRVYQTIEALAAQAGDAIVRIRAEQSLRTNRQLLKQTLYSLGAAVFFVEAKSNVIQECNPAASAIFGYAHEELVGRTPAMLHVDEAAEKQFRTQLNSAIREKGFLSEFEFTMKRKDGVLFPCEHAVMPIRDETDRIVIWANVIRDITDQKRTEEELRNLSQRIIEAQEGERLRVARDLHDGVNQIIASAKMRLTKVEENASGLSPMGREMLARCRDLLVQALEENRRIAYNLRPSDLDELGLPEACRNLCETVRSRTNLTVKYESSGKGERLSPAIELNLFRVLQEALSNIEKHANARNVRVRLVIKGDSAVLQVQDDGSGFGPESVKAAKRRRSGAGLTNIRERAVSLGGQYTVKSAPDQGTVITVKVPYKPVN